MAAYLQRLIERANGVSDAQPRMTPFIRHWTKDASGENENSFESISQSDTADITVQSPAFNENKANIEGHSAQRQMLKHNTSSPEDESTRPAQFVLAPEQSSSIKSTEDATTLTKAKQEMESGVQLNPGLRQQTEDDTISIRPKKTNQYNVQSPLSPKNTRVQNSASSLHQTMPKSNVAKKPEMNPSQTQKDSASLTVKPPLRPAHTPIETMVRAEEKNMAQLSPRNSKTPASPLPAREPEQPSLVIGCLQVDVVPHQPEAPPPQPVPVASRVESSQQKRNIRLSSKLRFGLGQI